MKDEIKHYLVSVLGSFLMSIFLIYFLDDNELAIMIGSACMLMIGILKEVVWDWLMKRGVPSLADITSDAMGVGTALFIMYMFI